MPFPKLTWAGLLIATLGWGFILSYPLIASLVPDGGAPESFRDPARFIPLLGENAIITGFSLALLGTLERGLRLLTRIASASAPSNRSVAKIPAPIAHSLAEPLAQNPAVAAALTPQRSPDDIVTKGALNGRDYVLFRDGSVMVETLLGPRRFPSVTEAQAFIGGG